MSQKSISSDDTDLSRSDTGLSCSDTDLSHSDADLSRSGTDLSHSDNVLSCSDTGLSCSPKPGSGCCSCSNIRPWLDEAFDALRRCLTHPIADSDDVLSFARKKAGKQLVGSLVALSLEVPAPAIKEPDAEDR